MHLFSQAGGQLRYAPRAGGPDPELRSADVALCGGGRRQLHARTESVRGVRGRTRRRTPHRRHDRLRCRPDRGGSRGRYLSLLGLPSQRARKAWVDLQNDVTISDLELAVRENLRSVEHVKRYTTSGMAVDQGKTSNMNALGILAELTDRTIPELGTTTFRPPYDPVTLGTLAAHRVGALYHPLRRTPLDAWHAAHGAVFDDFGGWRRPAWYARPGESREACIQHEKRAARTAVSLFDGSPLGKLEVRGPDAAIFLNRMYYNTVHTLPVGKVRYGIMLNEHGTIIDDGVCMRLGEDHFLVSTTSGAASRIFAVFEDWLQCEWPNLRVLVTNLTSAWGNIAVAGPKARELVQRLGTDIDLKRETFPHLAVRCGTLAGVPARIARVGFTGELSFELNVPAGYTLSLWEALLAHGADLEVSPIGLEALQELRTEKGFLHVGTDTDSRTLPIDIGWGGILSTKTEDFIGRRSLDRSDAKRLDRLQYVGLAAEDPGVVLPIGAHVVAEPADPKARPRSEGYVTSSCASEALGRSVALGLVRTGRARLGVMVHVYSGGRIWPAQIVAPGAYDPKGERLHA